MSEYLKIRIQFIIKYEFIGVRARKELEFLDLRWTSLKENREYHPIKSQNIIWILNKTIYWFIVLWWIVLVNYIKTSILKYSPFFQNWKRGLKWIKLVYLYINANLLKK